MATRSGARERSPARLSGRTSGKSSKPSLAKANSDKACKVAQGDGSGLLLTIKKAFQAGLSAHSIALSIAVGMYGGLFPIWGTQSIVIIALGTPLRGVNMVISIAINQLMSGIALALIPFFIRIGERALFVNVPFDASSLVSKLQEDPWGTMLSAQEALLHAALGWCLLLPCVAVLYSVIRTLLAMSSLLPQHDKAHAHRVGEILSIDVVDSKVGTVSRAIHKPNASKLSPRMHLSRFIRRIPSFATSQAC